MVPRYSRKEMLEIWSDISKYSIWLDIEIHALEGMEKVGIVPVGTAEIVRKTERQDKDIIKIITDKKYLLASSSLKLILKKAFLFKNIFFGFA